MRPVQLVVVRGEVQRRERRGRSETVSGQMLRAVRQHRQLSKTPFLPDCERDHGRGETGEHRTGELEASAVRKCERRAHQEQRSRRLDRDRRSGRDACGDTVEQ